MVHFYTESVVCFSCRIMCNIMGFAYSMPDLEPQLMKIAYSDELRLYNDCMAIITLCALAR